MGKNELINSISSYDTNIMLAAIISLLVVILFVLLLHIYARWFFSLSPSPSPSSSSTSASVNSYTFNPPSSTFHSSPSPSKSKGLDPSLVASIPLFVFQEEEEEQEKRLECVICLSVFEENEIGRRLKKCGHGFHVECIDMWLNSHLNCPICRAPAVEFTAKEEDQIAIDVQNENVSGNSVVNFDSFYPSSSSSSSDSSDSSSSLGCSLMRMLSRNRSEGCKVFSSVNNELGV